MFFLYSEKPPVEATFAGSEYLTYDLSSRGDSFISSTDQLTMYFKTRQANGLLFYTGKSVIFLQSVNQNNQVKISSGLY